MQTRRAAGRVCSRQRQGTKPPARVAPARNLWEFRNRVVQSAAPYQPDRNGMPAPSPIRILFAEDEKFLRELLTKQLQANGYVVAAVQSGDEALAVLLAGVGIDILLTDINMPGTLDGWALAERLRLTQPRLGVIYATNERQDPSRQLTDSEFVAKPYDLAAIIAAIHRITSDQADTPVPPPKKKGLTRPDVPDALPQ